MPRPPKPVTRGQQVKLSLTLEEYEQLRIRASAAGQRPSSYARALIMGSAAPTGTAPMTATFDRLVYQQWVRVGNNLNQMTRQLHLLQHPAAGETETVLMEIRDLIGRARP